MSTLNILRHAAHLYIKQAYPEGPPDKIQKIMDQLRNLESDEHLRGWEAFEKEAGRYCLRLGNAFYPHMKLVFYEEEQKAVFYVDAHDSHFNLPPNMPGYDKLILIRKKNGKLKKAIESAWYCEKIPIFGQINLKAKGKKDCSKLSVLAIDDEPNILDMLGIIIQSTGATYYKADTISDAKKAFEEHPQVDLIFCDVMMPVESGYDFVAWLKEQHCKTPVYFITGMTMDSVVCKGVKQVLQKPFSPRVILNILRATAHREDNAQE